ncbi:MAG: HAMP domain-containing histidine kinase [Chloroflexi bacterium]|nr:HAMP domain-containing histidine kinase [Chloroflexota bacterium]MBT5318341.1 HAMP domain-containing histidine kinase [Chloroflexota bacterium]
MRRFKFTIAFLVISALTLGIAGVVILNVSNGVEERNISGLMAEQSARDARLLADAVSRVLSEDQTTLAAGDGVKVANSTTTTAQSTIGAFLGDSDVIRLALYEIDGQSAWSSDARNTPISGQSVDLFRGATEGKVVSGLIRGEQLTSHSRTLDVVESYVPFIGIDTNAPVRVLGVTRDVTDALALRVDTTRSAMFRSTAMTLGAGFFLILAFVVIGDRAIWSAKEREIRKERELSEQRVAAARLDASNRELQHLNDERGKLIGLVSHELRTPLTGVLAFTDIVSKRQTGDNAEKNREHLGIVKRSGTQLLEMIDEMLDMSRLEATGLPLDLADLDVSDLVSDVSQKIDPILQIKKQKLQVFGDVSGYRIQADRSRLDQVMMNLLSNASKYSPAGTAIKLEVEITDGELEVSVSDQGIGIDQEDHRRVFGKFYRVDREETRTVPGTGLGLAIVKSIIDRHGGDVSVEDGPEGGSRFTFKIPATVRTRTPSEFAVPLSVPGYSAGNEIATATD